MITLNTKSQHIYLENREELKSTLESLYESKPSVVIFCDKNIEDLSFLPQTLQKHVKRIKASEKLKSFKNIKKIYQYLQKIKATRHTHLLLIGGGSLIDALGFVASTYLRGIPYSTIPTTLLAQVDSALGGKTAINLAGKNLVGSFYWPEQVLICSEFLNTLPDREITSGLGECFKYALLLKEPFNKEISLDTLKKYGNFKSQIVEKDPFDSKGMREVLNLGHTLAHALEKVEGFEKWRHGEAVLRGIHFNMFLSMKLNLISIEQFDKLVSSLANFEIPHLSLHTSIGKLTKSMQKDKKNHNNHISILLFNKTLDIEKFLIERKELKRYLKEYVRNY
ncbi:MAG: 3-dehydroquinate synthase [Halobacteriovoraceae bacterium]|nr:3-dehydroquinate synthase [Halobacteriovoraceae bacterium]MCB9093620.1 3-dehydroquinate synthase [Halobacteriovoraceae bacterium]